MDTNVPYQKVDDGFKIDCAQHVSKYVAIFGWLPKYRWAECLLTDIAGGLTLGCILVAQSLAHAVLSGVDLVHGPYTCILPPIVYAVFGTCIQGSVGTSSLVALLTGSYLAKYTNIDERTHAAAIFTLLVGIVLSIMGVCRLSFLVRFLSRPALSGFMTGSAMIIMAAMVGGMLGLPHKILADGGIVHILFFHCERLEFVNIAAMGISFVSVVFLTTIKKLERLHWMMRYVSRFKDIVVLLSSALFSFFCAERFGIGVVGTVPQGLPPISIPFNGPDDIALAKELLPGAVMLALICFIQSFAPAKKFAVKNGYQISPVSELFASGLANIAGGMSGAMPSCIGLSRIGIADQLGVKSQFGSNMIVGIFVACSLQFLSRMFYFIPRCALNSVIFCGVISLMEFDQLHWLCSLRAGRKQRKDVLVWVVACSGTLLLGAISGICLAASISMLLIVYDVVEPEIHLLGRLPLTGHWVNVTVYPDAKTVHDIMVLRLAGPIFYANAEHLQQIVEDLELNSADRGETIRAIILSLSSVAFVDATALQVLSELVDSLRARGVLFFVSGAHGSARLLIEQVLGSKLPQHDLHLTIDECVGKLEDGGFDVAP